MEGCTKDVLISHLVPHVLCSVRSTTGRTMERKVISHLAAGTMAASQLLSFSVKEDVPSIVSRSCIIAFSELSIFYSIEDLLCKHHDLMFYRQSEPGSFRLILRRLPDCRRWRTFVVLEFNHQQHGRGGYSPWDG